jgi:hypothetical protein
MMLDKKLLIGQLRKCTNLESENKMSNQHELAKRIAEAVCEHFNSGIPADDMQAREMAAIIEPLLPEPCCPKRIEELEAEIGGHVDVGVKYRDDIIGYHVGYEAGKKEWWEKGKQEGIRECSKETATKAYEKGKLVGKHLFDLDREQAINESYRKGKLEGRRERQADVHQAFADGKAKGLEEAQKLRERLSNYVRRFGYLD